MKGNLFTNNEIIGDNPLLKAFINSKGNKNFVLELINVKVNDFYKYVAEGVYFYGLFHTYSFSVLEGIISQPLSYNIDNSDTQNKVFYEHGSVLFNNVTVAPNQIIHVSDFNPYSTYQLLKITFV